MPNPLRTRGELVISMTLAETFLLLVFMLWYSIRPKLAAQPPSPVEVLQKENKDLREQKADLERKLAETRELLDLWQKRFNQAKPGSDEELKKALAGGGRGKPKCQADNLLLEISLIDGATTMKVIADNPVLRSTLRADNVDFRVGAVITNPQQIDSILQHIRDFRNAGGDECRFDYRFAYANYEDYYIGRERFEKYLYSAARGRAASPPGMSP